MKLAELVKLSNEIRLSLVETAGEITDETTTALMILETNLPVKADGYKFILDEIEAESDKFKERAEEFLKLSKSFKNYAEGLKGHLKISCIKMDIKELVGNDYYWKLQTSKPSVIVDDESKVPGKYKEVQQTIVIKKDLVLADLKAGIVIDGIRLEHNQHIRCYPKGATKKESK